MKENNEGEENGLLIKIGCSNGNGDRKAIFAIFRYTVWLSGCLGR